MKKRTEKFEIAQKIARMYKTEISTDFLVNSTYKIAPEFQEILEQSTPFEYRKYLNDFLMENYLFETTIKAAFLKKVLFKQEKKVSIFEFSVGKNRVDLCAIGRESIAYEIKTELDSPIRLPKQIVSYSEVFDYTYLICYSKDLEKMQKKLLDSCGIYIYDKDRKGNITFRKIKNAKKSTRISPRAQLNIISKNELMKFFNSPFFEEKENMINYLIEKNNIENNLNKNFKKFLKNKFGIKWRFLVDNRDDILEMDYQWFFNNMISPQIVYYSASN